MGEAVAVGAKRREALDGLGESETPAFFRRVGEDIPVVHLNDGPGKSLLGFLPFTDFTTENSILLIMLAGTEGGGFTALANGHGLGAFLAFPDDKGPEVFVELGKGRHILCFRLLLVVFPSEIKLSSPEAIIAHSARNVAFIIGELVKLRTGFSRCFHGNRASHKTVRFPGAHNHCIKVPPENFAINLKPRRIGDIDAIGSAIGASEGYTIDKLGVSDDPQLAKSSSGEASFQFFDAFRILIGIRGGVRRFCHGEEVIIPRQVCLPREISIRVESVLPDRPELERWFRLRM